MSRATAYEAKGDLAPRHRRLRPGAQARSQSHRGHDQPRPRLAPQRQPRPRHRRLRSGRSGSTRRTSPPTTTAPSRWPTGATSTAPLADYEQALKLDPKYALAYLNRGLLWHARKDYDRAIADFDQAIRLAPDNAAAATTPAALALDAKGEFDRAIADFDRAIALEPNNANYLRQPRQRLARPRPLRPRGRGLRQGDRAGAGLCLRLLQPLAGALPGRPVSRGAGRRRQGRGAQREFGQRA